MLMKAPTLGADSYILDLEDSVPEANKDEARRTVVRLSDELDWGSHELCVRINPRGSTHFARDIAAVKKAKRIDCVVLPKAEGDCSIIHERAHRKVMPIIETAAGFTSLRKVVRSRGVTAISFGAADYAASVGGDVSAYQDNETLKTIMVAAAADSGVDAIDNVFFDLVDLKGFRTQAETARSLGFVGKQLVHPSQVSHANNIFTPRRSEIEWAEKVVAAMGAAALGRRGAVRLGGSLVDAVHFRLANRLIERAREAGLSA